MLTLVDYGEIFVFIFLGLSSIVALAVIIERAILFRRYGGKQTLQFFNSAVSLLRREDAAGLAELMEGTEQNIYARFLKTCMAMASKGRDKFSEMISGVIIEEELVMEKRLTVLNTLGNNAPFIGLLGTVLGVIKAFHGLGTLGNNGAEVVMRSISSALLATAAGLFIAIPVVMTNNYFSRKIKNVMKNLDILAKASYALHGHRNKTGE